MSNRRPSSVLVPALALALAAASSSACFEKREDTCEYWVPKLSSPQMGDEALRKVEALRCSAALPALKQMFDDGLYQEQILRTLKQIGDKSAAAPILKSALMNKEVGKLAASIVTDWALADAKPELVQILTGPNLPKHRPEALTALLSFEKPEAIEDLLVQLATDDPNLQGIDVNRMAVEKLGELGSAKAVPALVRAAFLRDNRGAMIYRSARIALARTGPAATDELIATIEGKNEALKTYARESGIQDWEWRSGPEIVQLLTDQLDPKAGVPVVKSIAQELVKPTGVSPAMEEKWRVGQMNRLKVAMLGLGHVGPADAIPDLQKIVQDPLADAVNQRLHSATALSLIGTPAAQDALLAIYAAETDDRFRAPLLRPILMGLDHAHLEAFRAARAKEKIEPGSLVDEGLKAEQVVAYMGVVDTCKTDTGCYASKLKSQNKDEVIKAAVLLARVPGDAPVRKALIDRFVGTPADQIDIRRFTLMALTRIGDASTGEELLKIARNLEPADRYWPDELEVYGNALKHRK